MEKQTGDIATIQYLLFNIQLSKLSMKDLLKYSCLLLLILLCLANHGAEGKEDITQSGTDVRWTTYAIPHYRSIYHLSFTAGNRGWATGEGGILLSYNGSEWSQVTSPAQEQIFSLSFAKEGRGYTVGSRGTMFLYENGHWTQENLDSEWDIMDVFFLNTAKGWAVGENSTIFHFEGEGWKGYDAPRIGYLTRVFFADQNNGWIVGNNGFDIPFIMVAAGKRLPLQQIRISMGYFSSLLKKGGLWGQWELSSATSRGDGRSIPVRLKITCLIFTLIPGSGDGLWGLQEWCLRIRKAGGLKFLHPLRRHSMR